MILSFHTDRPGQTVQIWANSADPHHTEQSDQGLHCLQFHLHLLEAFLYVKPRCSNFRVITAKFRMSQFLGFLW